MKRKYSLKGKRHFKNVFRKGKKLKGNFVQILVLKSNENRYHKQNGKEREEFEIKIGFSVPKRFGKAVRRNWAKRRIRSIVSDLIPEMNGSYCIIIKPELRFREEKFTAIQEEIRNLLEKAGVIQL